MGTTTHLNYFKNSSKNQDATSKVVYIGFSDVVVVLGSNCTASDELDRTH